MYTAQEGENGYNAANAESKYVADILSSMANGEPATTNYPLPNYLSGVSTGTTATLTPTTLASMEQTFIELQSVPANSANHDPRTQSGFVPPIVDPVSREQSCDGYDYSDSSQSDAEWSPSSKRVRLDANGGYIVGTEPRRKRRALDEKDLSEEEIHRRRVRRERNKLAAAKCRQRRVDHTNKLVDETDKLEAERSELENEIQSLQQQKDQLEFILQAHQPLCKVDNGMTINRKGEPIKVKSEPRHSQCGALDFTSGSARPTSLHIVKREKEVNNVPCTLAGIPITTPSSGLFSFNGLDNMVGSTGLTPVTSSCSSEVHRSSSESSEAIGSPTLISL